MFQAPTSPPLDPRSLSRVRALIARVGERRALELLDLPRPTLARAAAGLGVRRATAEVIRMRLDAADEEPPARRVLVGGAR